MNIEQDILWFEDKYYREIARYNSKMTTESYKSMMRIKNQLDILYKAQSIYSSLKN